MLLLLLHTIMLCCVMLYSTLSYSIRLYHIIISTFGESRYCSMHQQVLGRTLKSDPRPLKEGKSLASGVSVGNMGNPNLGPTLGSDSLECIDPAKSKVVHVGSMEHEDGFQGARGE